MIHICGPGFGLYMRILLPVNYIMSSPFGNLIGIIIGDMKNEALKSFWNCCFQADLLFIKTRTNCSFLSGIYFPSLFLQSTYTVPLVETMLGISVAEGMISCGYLVFKGGICKGKK